MRLKRKQLQLIIEELILEQEDTGLTDKVAGAAEEIARNPYLGDAGDVLDIVQRDLDTDPTEIDNESYPVNSKIVHILEDFYNYLREDDEAQRKWGTFAAVMAAPGGKLAAAKELGSGVHTIYQIASVGGVTIADVAASEAIVAVAGAAAAEAILVSYAVGKTAQAGIAAAQAVAADIEAQGSAMNSLSRKVLMKMFTKAVKRAQSEKISKNLSQKAHSEMVSFLEGNVKEPLMLMYILAFITPGDAVAAIEEVSNELHAAGIGGSMMYRSMLGTQYKMIGLVQKSRKFANEVNEEANQNIMSTIQKFKKSV